MCGTVLWLLLPYLLLFGIYRPPFNIGHLRYIFLKFDLFRQDILHLFELYLQFVAETLTPSFHFQDKLWL